MVKNGSFNDGQAEPHAARFCRAKWRKDLVFQIGRNSFAVVLHRDNYALVCSPSRTGRAETVILPFD